jgi:hypothetical protein
VSIRTATDIERRTTHGSPRCATLEKALTSQLEQGDVVVTHHLPAFESVPARFVGSATFTSLTKRRAEGRPHVHDRQPHAAPVVEGPWRERDGACKSGRGPQLSPPVGQTKQIQQISGAPNCLYPALPKMT